MFDSVLIANRGEIAVRVARTARRLGLTVVAVYADVDADAMHVRAADRAVAIGPVGARPYLDAARIVAAARESGAAAIHPGYGFLSENAAFAEAVAAAGLVWVGPPPAAIRAMGSKSQAKALMERAGVPVVPGYHGEMQEPAFLKQKAYEIGYPVLIKAVAGGGGKGMRRVDKMLQFEDALAAARREADGAFGDGRVLVEKYVERPRHVEVQVFADAHGRTVSLFERDCSVQRRHQKIVEEAPGPGVSPDLRARLGDAAVRAARAVGYVGAGTVEFIADGADLSRFYFMEMNTRLQVEHPVTELVAGLDLVEWQLRVAAGEALPEAPAAPTGHAVEVRLYAEDPDSGFLPSSGRVEVLRWGEGVRVDAGVEEGDVVSPHFDPMIAKVIAHAPDRAAAIAALARALGETVAIGPKTNLPFLRAVITHPEFAEGRHDTAFVERALGDLTGGGVSDQAVADAAATLVAALPPPRPDASGWVDPFAATDAWRLSRPATASVAFAVGGSERAARVERDASHVRVTLDGAIGSPDSPRVVRAGGGVFAAEQGRAVRVALLSELDRSLAEADPHGGAAAPMHGRITAVFVAPGDRVVAGAPLFAVEAMKMEHLVRATAEGVVAAVRFAPGAQVAEGAEVIALAEADAAAGAVMEAPPSTAVETAGTGPAAAADDAVPPPPDASGDGSHPPAD